MNSVTAVCQTRTEKVDVSDTFAGRVDDDTDCWTQNGNIRRRVVATFKRLFLTKAR